VSKALSFISCLFGLLLVGSTVALLGGPENLGIRPRLVGILVGEGIAFSALMFFVIQPSKVAAEITSIKPNPRERDRLPAKPNLIPGPIARRLTSLPSQPIRREPRPSDPLARGPIYGPRLVTLPPLPVLQSPSAGRRVPEAIPPPPPTRQSETRKPRFKLSDLQEQEPLPPPPPPRPKRPTKTPKRPGKTFKLRAGATELPATLDATHLPICVDIVKLATYCATADNGASSTDEDKVVESWIWTAVEHVSADADLAWTYHDDLLAAHQATRLSGKQKLDTVKATAVSIKAAAGRSKLVSASAWLCSEVIKADEKLDPGEAATFQTALTGLGKENSDDFKDVAKDLLLGDKEVKALLSELRITEKTPISRTNDKLLDEFSKCNARMQSCDGAAKEKLRQRLVLITYVRHMLQEIEAQEDSR
jgi:hypothetical protein